MADGLEGQRRQVTVMFADMVGYTTIAPTVSYWRGRGSMGVE